VSQPDLRELLLTVTPDQERELQDNVATLRGELGTPNATQTILEAVRRAAKVASTERTETT
jgi:hypothetical protein